MSALVEDDVNVLREDRKRSMGPRRLRVISESIRVKIPSHLERYGKTVGGLPGTTQQWFFQLFFIQMCALARVAETAHYFKSDQKCVRVAMMLFVLFDGFLMYDVLLLRV